MTTAPPISAPTLRPATVSSVRLDGRSAWRHRMRVLADALALRHQDEVLLQRRDHVAAQQPHVDRDLAQRQGDDGEQHVAEVFNGFRPERDVPAAW